MCHAVEAHRYPVRRPSKMGEFIPQVGVSDMSGLALKGNHAVSESVSPGNDALLRIINVKVRAPAAVQSIASRFGVLTYSDRRRRP